MRLTACCRGSKVFSQTNVDIYFENVTPHRRHVETACHNKSA